MPMVVDEVSAQPETTLAAEDSVDQALVDGRLALLWLFPELRCCSLDVGFGPWRLGRDPGCEISLEDGQVSREQAEIFYTGPLVVLRDLRSRNGTFVNGVRIEQVPIKPGAILRVGDHVGTFCRVSRQLDLPESFAEWIPGFFVGLTLRRVLDNVARAAASDLPILIQGATGTGKERVAEYVHIQSGRSGPFHPINCATIPPEIAESELFGHRRGAFTGAREASVGHFRAAHGGTLFLDEVAELPLPVQAKLLRVLQEQKVTALGDTLATPVDVRVIAACQEPLAVAVERATFRTDLFARIAGVSLVLPPLAERVEEVPWLFRHFLELHSGGNSPRICGKVIERLCLYSWPRNVRELELLVRQLLAVHGHEPVLRCRHLPDAIRSAGMAQPLPMGENLELERLVHALHNVRGNITQACSQVGISRAKAYRLLGGKPIEQLLARYPKSESKFSSLEAE